MEQVTKAEELARSVFAGKMANGNFCHSEARVFNFLREFHADHAASGFQFDSFENAPSEQPEIAIDVTYRESKNPAHRLPVNTPDPDPVPGICSLHFITINEVDIRRKAHQQVVYLADVVLPIPIGVEDDILLGVPKPGDQRRAVSQVAFVVDDTKER